MRLAILVLAALASLTVAPAFSAELPPPVARWYEALRKADAEAISGLLAEDAKIDLKDLGVVQTRDEFIESMDAWADAIDGGLIETKPAEGGEEGVAVDVCYRFPGNQQRNREVFTLAGERIAGVVQEAVAADCDGF